MQYSSKGPEAYLTSLCATSILVAKAEDIYFSATLAATMLLTLGTVYYSL